MFAAANRCWVLLTLSVCLSTTGAADAGRLNLVVIVADDLGAHDLGCTGSKFYETPHLDRLAREGACFTAAYAAAPVCSPTRAALLTGQYPARTGVTDVIGRTFTPEAWTRNTKLLPAPHADRLPHATVTAAELLREVGYSTFFAGKWHLGPEGWWPEDQGFAVNRGGTNAGGPYAGGRYFSPYANPRLTDGPPGEHLGERLAEEAARFIASSGDKPFFCYLATYDVHTPLMARAALVKKYEDKRQRLADGASTRWGRESSRVVRLTQDHVTYAAMVEVFDAMVGRVLAQIDASGQRERTVVIVTSDNGGVSTGDAWGTANTPLRAGKGWLYEGGLRVPLIVRWPGVTTAGAVVATPVHSIDLLPTLLDAGKTAAREDSTRDGASLRAAIEGRSATRPLFWHFPHYGNLGGAPGAAMRDGTWKLIAWAEEERVELFNLEADPGESRDLAEREPARVTQMLTTLKAWQRETEARFPIPNPRFDPSAVDGRAAPPPPEYRP